MDYNLHIKYYVRMDNRQEVVPPIHNPNLKAKRIFRRLLKYFRLFQALASSTKMYCNNISGRE